MGSGVEGPLVIVFSLVWAATCGVVATRKDRPELVVIGRTRVLCGIRQVPSSAGREPPAREPVAGLFCHVRGFGGVAVSGHDGVLTQARGAVW